MKQQQFFLSMIASGIIAWIIAAISTPALPDIARYAYCGAFLLGIPVIYFILSRDVRYISLIFFLAPTYYFYFRPLLSEEYHVYYLFVFEDVDLEKAALFTLLAMMSSMLGWRLALIIPIRPLLKNLQGVRFSPEFLAHVSMFISILSIIAEFNQETWGMLSGYLGQVVFLLNQLPMLALALGAIAILDGYKNPLFIFWIFGPFLAFHSLLIIAHTLLHHLLVMIIPLLFIYSLKTHRIPWLYGLILFVLILPVFQSRMDARVKLGYLGDLTVFERLELGYKHFEQAWSEQDSAVRDQRKNTTEKRTNILPLLAHCIHYQEEKKIAFKYGGTFWWLPLSPIPRFIFPWKPYNDHGLTFGVEYGLREPQAKFAVVLPLMVESYINGGVIGVILINIFLGIAYYVCFALFNHGQGTSEIVVLCSVLYLISNVENNITLLFGGALQAMAFWYVFDRFAISPRHGSANDESS